MSISILLWFIVILYLEAVAAHAPFTALLPAIAVLGLVLGFTLWDCRKFFRTRTT